MADIKLPQLNVVTLCGRLVADPHPLTAKGDREGSAFTIALNKTVGKGRPQITTFVDICAWGELASAVNKYLGKGAPVLVSGSLAQYEKKNGKSTVKVLQVSASAIQFLEKAPDQQPDAPESNAE